MSTFALSLACGLFLLAPARALEAGVPPLGPRCSWRLFPDTLLDFSQFCCFQIPESTVWNVVFLLSWRWRLREGSLGHCQAISL